MRFVILWLTLGAPDHLLVTKSLYGVRIPFTDRKRWDTVRPPQRGEVVVFNLRGGQVYVKGKPLPRQMGARQPAHPLSAAVLV